MKGFELAAGAPEPKPESSRLTSDLAMTDCDTLRI
jgi:hypothetical protein